MATKHKAPHDFSTEPAPAPGPDPAAPVVAEPTPAPLIGAACDPMTPGFIMGIGKVAETKGEHDTRLGASAGTFSDTGAILGTLEARDNWPAMPVAAAVTP